MNIPNPPHPVEAQGAFREWAKYASLTLILSFGDEPFTRGQIVEALWPKATRAMRWSSRPFYARSERDSITKALRSGISRAINEEYGPPIDKNGAGDMDSYAEVPKNGTYSTAYIRRRGALTLEEELAVQQRFQRLGDRYSRYAAWWGKSIAKKRAAQRAAQKVRA